MYKSNDNAKLVSSIIVFLYISKCSTSQLSNTKRFLPSLNILGYMFVYAQYITKGDLKMASYTSINYWLYDASKTNNTYSK